MMGNRILYTGLIIFILLLGITVFADDLDDIKSHRKAIAAVETVARTSNNITFNSKQVEIITNAFKEAIVTERFDHIELPEKIQKQLHSQIASRSLSEDEILQIIDRVAKPEIEGIMAATAEYRAEYDNPHFDRVNFLTKTADSYGITLEDMERMMECGYLFVPFVSEYKIDLKKNKDGVVKDANISLKGGAYWYHLAYAGDEAEMIKLGTVKSSAQANKSGLGDIFKKSDLAPELAAFKNASELLAENIYSESRREFPELRIYARIARVENGKAAFYLGEKEGVLIDDRFLVYDQIEDVDGNIHNKKKGVIMVREVADNDENDQALSYGKPIIGSGNLLGGLQLQEVPVSAYDLSIKLGWRPLEFGELNVSNGGTTYMSLNDKVNNGIITASLDLQLNVGRRLGVPQFFLSFGGGYGYAITDLSLFADEKIDQGNLWSLHAGLVKRMYFGRMSFVLGADGTYNLLSFNKKVNETNYSLKRNYFGAVVRGGFDFALSATLNIGLRGGYVFNDKGSDWKFEIDDEEQTWFNDEDFDITFDGPYASLVVSYTLPSLFWSPF